MSYRRRDEGGGGEVRMDFSCLKGCHVQGSAKLGVESDGYKRED